MVDVNGLTMAIRMIRRIEKTGKSNLLLGLSGLLLTLQGKLYRSYYGDSDYYDSGKPIANASAGIRG
jgi:hypothetical protein